MGCGNYQYFIVATPPQVGREPNTYKSWLDPVTLTLTPCLQAVQEDTWEPYPQGIDLQGYHLHIYDEPVEGMLVWVSSGETGLMCRACHSHPSGGDPPCSTSCTSQVLS